MVMKKGLRLSFAVIVSVSLALTGCGNSTKSNQAATTTEQASKSDENPYAKSFDISWVSWNCGDIEPDNWAEKKLEEKLNIKLTTKKVDLAQTEQVDLMLASGEMPDCGWILKSSVQMDKQGLIRTIPINMIKQYAPNYTKLLNSEPVGWKLNNAEGKTDEFLALTGYQAGNQNAITFISSYRLDWLENVGIKPNGTLEQIDKEGKMFLTSTPFTQDQFTKILEAFTKSDPDKNGKDDTVGMTAASNGNFFWNPIYGMFGFQDNGIIEENGKAMENYVSNSYKEFLKYAADLYKKGYIDKEFPTLNNDKAWEKVTSGKAGYCGTSALWSNKMYKARPPLNMLQKDPNAKVLITPPETGKNGKGGTRPYSSINYTYTFYVSKNVKDDKLARILQMFDYINFDKDAKLFLRYGEEGTHFKWSGTPNESSPILNEGVKSGSKYGILSYNSNYIAEYDIKKLGWEEPTTKIMKHAWDDWKKSLLPPFKVDLFNQTKYTEYQIQNNAATSTIVKEFYLKAITGEINIDNEWNAYIKKVNDAGYSKMQEEIDKMQLYKDIVK